LILQGYHVLCSGETGTGKSVVVKNLLNHAFDDTYSDISINFSARTSANQTQDLIDVKLDKRRKGVFGPPLGNTCIVFVDDLSMPKKEEYGAQPPIELLRQWMDHRGWYDRSDGSFRNLVDIQFVAAMGPPGGGRTKITQRYIRHFNLINFVPFDDQSLSRVFGTIVDWFLAKGFDASIKKLKENVVDATIHIYNAIAATLLPTPAKSHYLFNLRDLSKVFQGVAQGSSDVIQEKSQFVRLWSHECLRVFYDRLINEGDRDWFIETLKEVTKGSFNLDWSQVQENPDKPVVFGNYSNPRAIKKVYQEIDDMEILSKVMNDYLDDYNAVSNKPMDLVLFQNAIDHVSKISRVINQPYGNALLVGVGGSGRKSATKLAVFIADYELFQIEISKSYGMVEWREDLKAMMMKAVIENQPTVFLLDDI
jgi:dynein heavy chain